MRTKGLAAAGFCFAALAIGLAAGLVAPLSAAQDAQPADRAPLQLEAKIPLGDVAGRIDHLAVDRERQRLFVAELGNDSVGIIDLKNHKLIRRITGLGEPQGVGYVQSTDTLYVANARDGSVRLFQGDDYQPAASSSERMRTTFGSVPQTIRFLSATVAAASP